MVTYRGWTRRIDMSIPENRQPRSKPAPITAEEFDRRTEEGEDLDEYFDWQNAVTVMPGELTPGQKASLLEAFGELSPSDKVMLTQVMLDAVAGTDLHLNVPIPAALHLELARVALQRHMTREALVQSWIVQRLEEQRITA